MDGQELKKLVMAEMQRIVHDVWLDGPTAPQVDLTPESRFVEDLEIDSLASIEMILAAETAFEIDVPDGEVDGIRTLQEAADYVERKIAGR